MHGVSSLPDNLKYQEEDRVAVPFLKWAGGKAQLLVQMQPYFPVKFERYIEPFLGGGAVYFHLRPKKAILADSNPDLVNAFQVVRDSPEALMTELDRRPEFEATQTRFYEVRAQDPTTLSPVERAARTVFLNKTCFNGLYRVNAKGVFNVPWGHYKRPLLYERNNILGASRILKTAEILHADYRKACSRAKRRDFVYMDPPYHPVSLTSAFTGYTKEDFGEENQRELSATFGTLSRRGCLSNSV